MEVGNIAAALEVTKNISTQANNTIHLSLVEGSGINELGDLALQVSLPSKAACARDTQHDCLGISLDHLFITYHHLASVAYKYTYSNV